MFLGRPFLCSFYCYLLLLFWVITQWHHAAVECLDPTPDASLNFFPFHWVLLSIIFMWYVKSVHLIYEYILLPWLIFPTSNTTILGYAVIKEEFWNLSDFHRWQVKAPVCLKQEIELWSLGNKVCISEYTSNICILAVWTF